MSYFLAVIATKSTAIVEFVLKWFETRSAKDRKQYDGQFAGILKLMQYMEAYSRRETPFSMENKGFTSPSSFS